MESAEIGVLTASDRRSCVPDALEPLFLADLKNDAPQHDIFLAAVHVKQLSKVQVGFIRQMFNLYPRSMIAPLFTETGIMPFRVRPFE